MSNNIVIVWGGGDIGTGVAHRLHQSGFTVLVLETDQPLVIRRKVAFAQAVYDGTIIVEGVTAIKAASRQEIDKHWQAGHVPVLVDSCGSIIQEIRPFAVIDARLTKTNAGMQRDLAPVTIGLGPGFNAGNDVDAVIETKRGHDLGRVILEGRAEPDTGIPEAVNGFTTERVLRAPCNGTSRSVLVIGEMVAKGQTVLYIDQEPVIAELDGVVRGVIMQDVYVAHGQKIGDIDPRGVQEYCYTVSDKARAIGGGVLEALLLLIKKRQL